LCEDLVDEEDMSDEPIIDVPVPNNVYKRQRKKSLMIRLICGEVIE
jgi:hypothetical protein